ncbi:hypothetical protein [Polluticaenibacter yanchengensis]|uniref:Uncharacterized protein n=1 Tax=Polluticaenibacter yanchengensis TaxID=3014562 RepID=A0ABT4UPJ6_9BACT|nr:hypothetical protein [Chitinophagaceae bacterium LY-5]
MKAGTQYNDFVGTAAADISDYLGSTFGNSLKSLGEYFKLNLERFKVVGVSIHGSEDHYISLICVDNIKSNTEKEYITSISIDVNEDKDFLSFLFKTLHVVLYSRHDNQYSILKCDEEANYEDYHEVIVD